MGGVFGNAFCTNAIQVCVCACMLSCIQIYFSRYYEILWSKVAQSCPTLCDPMDCSLLGSSVHWIFQSRILEWVAISFSRGSSQPRDWTLVFCIAGRHFYHLNHQEIYHSAEMSFKFRVLNFFTQGRSL